MDIHQDKWLVIDDDRKVKDDDDDDDDDDNGDDKNNDEQPRKKQLKSPTLMACWKIHLLKNVSVILNLPSRAESTIFIATTINNQHFLQISAPLFKIRKKFRSVNHPPNY